MRKIDKSKVHVPRKLKDQNCIDLIDLTITNIGANGYSKAYYAHSTVHSQLFKLYNGKCAFCESDVRAGSALQIDHYRPKKRVSEDLSHPGYYWLGYEWTNLMPICSKCNRHKWDKFPIHVTGVRQRFHPVNLGITDYLKFKISSKELSDEKPLLLNPEVINPVDYFIFLPSGKIKGKGQDEADITIDTCKLNRQDLRIARKKLRDNLLRHITKHLSDYHCNIIDKKGVIYSIEYRLADLLEIYVSNGPYSIYCLNVIKHFNYFITRKFRKNDALIINEAYDRFIIKSKAQLK